jgi:hypothetical protein
VLFFQSARANTMKFEVAKALLQLGVIAVIGTVVSLLVAEYQRERQTLDKERERERDTRDKKRELNRKRFEYREELLKSILVRAMAAYSAVKKARRLLRARAIIKHGDDPEVVLAEPYDLYLEMINDAQLNLENLARDIETSAQAFTDPKSLEKNVWKMEHYLSRLIEEYEEHRRMFAGNLASADLPLLNEFTGPFKGSNFEKEVVKPYHAVQRAIRADLLHPNLPGRNSVPGHQLQTHRREGRPSD